MPNMEKTGNQVIDKTFKFALDIIKYTDSLEVNRKYVLANQLLKSGTSIGANTREAQNAESRADFIHKFKIAAKEADETEYWLLLCKYSDGYPFTEELLINLKEIQKIINSIIHSSKTNSAQGK